MRDGCVRFAIWLINGLFRLARKKRVRHRVCFFSRQDNRISEDFSMLQRRLQKMDETLEIKTVCCRYRDRRDCTLRFLWQCFRSIFILASSKVCVLDSYWPVVSVLRDKQDLRVVQIWHSVGKIKQSGYQTLGRDSGRSPRLAELLCMHRNYDYVISGGEAWDEYYCAAFRIRPEQLRRYGLPRLDRLAQVTKDREAFLTRHPELAGKTIVLYAPTYRTYPMELPERFFTQFAREDYALICRMHPNQRLHDGEHTGRDYEDESIFELIRVCDYLITDYSSLALEAAAVRTRTLFYLFDNERYCRENGVNIDLMRIMPECAFTDETALFDMIDKKTYPTEKLSEFRRQFLPQTLGQATRRIAELILKELRGTDETLHHHG